MSELDPRWEWCEVRRLCDEQPTYIKGRCNHLEVEPVVSAGETVAHLCLTCDEQLPAEWVDTYGEAHSLAKSIRALRQEMRP